MTKRIEFFDSLLSFLDPTRSSPEEMTQIDEITKALKFLPRPSFKEITMFGPNNINLFGNGASPLVGTFGRSEREIAVALVIYTLQVANSDWRPVGLDELQNTIKASSDNLPSWLRATVAGIARPDFSDCVDRGILEKFSGMRLGVSDKAMATLMDSMWFVGTPRSVRLRKALNDAFKGIAGDCDCGLDHDSEVHILHEANQAVESEKAAGGILHHQGYDIFLSTAQKIETTVNITLFETLAAQLSDAQIEHIEQHPLEDQKILYMVFNTRSMYQSIAMQAFTNIIIQKASIQAASRMPHAQA